MTSTTRLRASALAALTLTALATVTLTGCSSTTPAPAFTNAVTIPNAPVSHFPAQPAASADPSATGSTTSTPTINLANGNTTITIAENAIAFIAGGPNDPANAWTATSTPAKQTNVMFVPGTATGQPSLQAFTAGTVTMNLTNTASGADTTLLITVTPTTLPTQTVKTTTTTTVDPHLNHTAGDKLAKTVIGMTEADATNKLAIAGYLARVTNRDGKTIPATQDYSTTRVNLTITAGTVTAATIG